MLGVDLRIEPSIVLDLSVCEPDGRAATPRDNAEPKLTARVFGAMRDAGVGISIGRYDEPRLLYVAPAFATGMRSTDEHRTIHIGLDLFAEAGTPVFAPLAGTVHAFADNTAPQDYGPVIVLRHVTDDGTEFFTLYGHLSRESLAALKVGQQVRAGDLIATLGAPEVNGGWTPHLHLQIITDLLGLGTDFPGVARPQPAPRLVRALSRSQPARARSGRSLPRDRAAGRGRRLPRAARRIGGNLSIAYREPVQDRSRLEAVSVRRRAAAGTSTRTTTCRTWATAIRASSMPARRRCGCSTRTRAI